MAATQFPTPRTPADDLPDRRGLLSRLWAVNAPLTLAGVAMLALLVLTLAGLVLDARVITGAPAWLKPSKFALSAALYSFTLVWLLGFVQGRPRLVRVSATVAALALAIELAIIVAQAARGSTTGNRGRQIGPAGACTSTL